LRSQVSASWVGPVIIFVNFLSLSFCIAAGVLKANPVACSIAEGTNTHILKGLLSFSRFKSEEEEANLKACALNGRPRHWMGVFGAKPAFKLLKMESVHLSIMLSA